LRLSKTGLSMGSNHNLKEWGLELNDAFMVGGTTGNAEPWLSFFKAGPVVMHPDGTDPGRTIQAFHGSMCQAVWQCKVPMKLIAMKLFSGLKKFDYKRSEFKALKIGQSNNKQTFLIAQAERYNTKGELYETVYGMYRLVDDSGSYLITELWFLADPIAVHAKLEGEFQISKFHDL